MKKGTNEPTLSDVLERIDKGFNDLTDFFSKSGVKDAEPTEPEWEDLTVTWTLNKEQAIEMWHRLNAGMEDIHDKSTDVLRLPIEDNSFEFWDKIDEHLNRLGIRKD